VVPKTVITGLFGGGKKQRKLATFRQREKVGRNGEIQPPASTPRGGGVGALDERRGNNGGSSQRVSETRPEEGKGVTESRLGNCSGNLSQQKGERS